MALFAFYGLCVAGAALVSVLLLNKFVAPGRVTPLVLVTVWYTWLTSLSVVALVPIDAFTTLAGYGNTAAITILWKISYWSTQALTWAIIPVLQGYSISGAFTVAGRIRSSLRRLWKFYLIVGGLSIAAILVAAGFGRLHLTTLPQLIVTLSNTYGLVAVVALLGYGLVELPRVLWRRSFPETRLKWHLHRVGRAAHRLSDASKELERCLAVVLITSQQVPRADASLREQADGLVGYADAASPVPLSALASSKIDVESLEERDLDYAGDAQGLAKLRGRVMRDIAEFVGSRGEYLSFVRKAMELEALCKARQLGVYSPPSGDGRPAASALWWYKCCMRPYVQRLGAIVAVVASAAVVWSEATIGTGRHPDLSPFSLAIHDDAVLGSTWGEQFLVAAPLAYVSACAFFSLFKLGSLGPYHIVAGATWSYSLLLNASLLARFAAPLCFNYLHVVRMTGGQRGGRRMVFVDLMGMEDVPLLGAGFNTWFPLVMVLYVGVLTTGVCEDCAAKLLTPARLRFNSESADDEHTARGQRLVAAEHEVLVHGGSLGEGTELFGMVPTQGGRGPLTAAAGGLGRGDSAAAAAGGRIDRQRRELQMGPSPEPSLQRDSALSMRQPLFGGRNVRSDAVSSPNDAGQSSYGGAASMSSPDIADQLFANVGSSRRG